MDNRDGILMATCKGCPVSGRKATSSDCSMCDKGAIYHAPDKEAEHAEAERERRQDAERRHDAAREHSASEGY